MQSKSKSMKGFLEQTESFFEAALPFGLPPFLMHPSESTPLNATPYLLSYARFQREATDWPGRGGLVTMLDEVIREAECLDLKIEAILVGGSFTELEKKSIGDLDCVIFYRLHTTRGTAQLTALEAIQQEAKARAIDARFVPLDSDPLVLIKLTSYFTILYSKHKENNEVVRGLLLLDCKDAA